MKSAVKYLFSVSILFNFLLSSLIADNPCNDYVDEVLRQLKADKDFFQEPYEIPDAEKTFGMYKIDEGHVYGMTTLHRANDAVPQKKGGNTQLKVYLGAGELSLKCKGKKKLFHVGPPIVVEADVPYVSMDFNVIPKPNGSNPEIKDFKVDEVKGMTVKISGLGVLRNVMHNAYVKLVGRFITRNVRRGVETRLKKFLKNKVKEFPIPSECLKDVYD